MKTIIKSDLFEGIMGREEFEKYQESLSLEQRKDLVLISISEPDNEEKMSDAPSKTSGFYDVLEIKFWDVEYNIDDYKPLTYEQGLEIRDFIIKNKDKKFLIHCAAGKSRSAGVGRAVECLVNFNGDVYNYLTSNSEITKYKRYSPNMTVFDRIIN